MILLAFLLLLILQIGTFLMAFNVSDIVSQMTTRVAALTDAASSAEALLASLKASLDNVEAELANLGVTQSQMQALSDLSDEIGARSAELATAVTANTEAPSEPPVETAPVEPPAPGPEEAPIADAPAEDASAQTDETTSV